MSNYLSFEWLSRFGAFGNQLWQIAGTIGEARKKGLQPCFPKWFYQPFFNFPEEMFFDTIPEAKDLGQQYMQDVDHWWDIRRDIFSYIGPSEQLAEKIYTLYSDINLSQYTAVHIRRANNLALPDHHPVPSLEYFEAGLSLIGNEKPVMVFSDDLEWCKKQSLFKDALFAKGNSSKVNVMDLTSPTPLALDTVALDFATMAMCRNFVISNSTFSGWAALLGTYQSFRGNTVVVPKNWYGKAINHIPYENMFRYYNWIRLDVQDGEPHIWKS
jgi:hypothetical protein